MKTVYDISRHAYRKRAGFNMDWLQIARSLLKKCAILVCPFFLTTVAYSEDDVDGPAADALYQQVFGTTPDPNGRNLLITKFHSTESVKSVLFDLVHSKEYKLLFVHNRSNTDIVKDLYRHVLARESDPNGLADWTRRLDAGESFDVVANGFINSKEYNDLFGENIIPSQPQIHVVIDARDVQRIQFRATRPPTTNAGSARTPQSTAVKDLSLFTAGYQVIGIRNSGPTCHVAIISWAPNVGIKKYKVEADSQIMIKVEDQYYQLIGEDPCP